jgi:mannose-6-phosphate isomerase-like protein (cupin superfamily)
MSIALIAGMAMAAVQPTASTSPPQVELVTSETLQSMVRTTKDGLAVHPVFTDPLSSALIVRRDSSGEVERHKSMNDIMVARSGTIRILVGGAIEGGRETTPGEWRGGRIVGGTERKLNPGDMLWIPAGVPHQMILPKRASFTYIAIKVPSR